MYPAYKLTTPAYTTTPIVNFTLYKRKAHNYTRGNEINIVALTRFVRV